MDPILEYLLSSYHKCKKSTNELITHPDFLKRKDDKSKQFISLREQNDKERKKFLFELRSAPYSSLSINAIGIHIITLLNEIDDIPNYERHDSYEYFKKSTTMHEEIDKFFALLSNTNYLKLIEKIEDCPFPSPSVNYAYLDENVKNWWIKKSDSTPSKQEVIKMVEKWLRNKEWTNKEKSNLVGYTEVTYKRILGKIRILNKMKKA